MLSSVDSSVCCCGIDLLTFSRGFGGFVPTLSVFLDIHVTTQRKRERVGPCRTFQIVYLTVSRLALYDYANSTGKKNILCALTIVFYSSEKRIYLYVYRTKAWVCEMFK